MDERLIPKDGVNPYADHPGFTATGCPIRYTVTQRGAYGGVRGGFGCEITGSHCLPGEHCAKRREDAAQQDALSKLLDGARLAHPDKIFPY
jgi:hypothetical protein